MSSYQFFLNVTRNKQPDEWPNWCVACRDGSSWHMSKADADKQLAHCRAHDVPARIYRVEFE